MNAIINEQRLRKQAISEARKSLMNHLTLGEYFTPDQVETLDYISDTAKNLPKKYDINYEDDYENTIELAKDQIETFFETTNTNDIDGYKGYSAFTDDEDDDEETDNENEETDLDEEELQLYDDDDGNLITKHTKRKNYKDEHGDDIEYTEEYITDEDDEEYLDDYEKDDPLKSEQRALKAWREHNKKYQYKRPFDTMKTVHSGHGNAIKINDNDRINLLKHAGLITETRELINDGDRTHPVAKDLQRRAGIIKGTTTKQLILDNENGHRDTKIILMENNDEYIRRNKGQLYG